MSQAQDWFAKPVAARCMLFCRNSLIAATRIVALPWAGHVLNALMWRPVAHTTNWCSGNEFSVISLQARPYHADCTVSWDSCCMCGV